MVRIKSPANLIAAIVNTSGLIWPKPERRLNGSHPEEAWRLGWGVVLLRSEVGQRSEKDTEVLRLRSSVIEQKVVSGWAPPTLKGLKTALHTEAKHDPDAPPKNQALLLRVQEKYFFTCPPSSPSTVCDRVHVPLPPSFLSFSAIICSCASGYACDMLTILLLNSGSRIPRGHMWGGGKVETGEEEEGEGGREHVGGRATEMNWGKDSPSLHQVSYCSHCGSGSQVIVVGPFILLQDLFCRDRRDKEITEYEESCTFKKKSVQEHTNINEFIFLKGFSSNWFKQNSLQSIIF